MAPADQERPGTESYFSPDYVTARARFREAARAAGAGLDELPLEASGPAGEPLTIDIACLGRRRASRVLRTDCSKLPLLLDHIIGAAEKQRRHVKAEFLGSPQVDN